MRTAQRDDVETEMHVVFDYFVCAKLVIYKEQTSRHPKDSSCLRYLERKYQYNDTNLVELSIQHWKSETVLLFEQGTFYSLS